MSRSRWCAKVPSRLRSGVAGPRLSRLVCLVSAATLGLVASTRIAQAQEEPLLRLTWQAPRSCPDERTVQQEIRALIDLQLKDNVKARIINAVQDNEYVSSNGSRKIRSQVEIYEYYQDLLRKENY